MLSDVPSGEHDGGSASSDTQTSTQHASSSKGNNSVSSASLTSAATAGGAFARGVWSLRSSNTRPVISRTSRSNKNSSPISVAPSSGANATAVGRALHV